MAGAAVRDILGDSRSAKCCIFQYSSPRSDREGLRSGGCEMTILSSDYVRIIVESSFYWRKQFTDFPVTGAVLGEFQG